MNERLTESKAILDAAIGKFEPRAIVLMFSGGNDSIAAYYVAKALGVKIDAIIHGVTGTGIRQTTEFCRKFAESEGIKYIEQSAGEVFEKRVLQDGFYGIGTQAHAFAYHVLKATVFRKAISHNFRFGKRNYNVLMLNGARSEESDNRANNINERWNVDPGAKPNIWVNILLNWSRRERDDFLSEVKAPVNPVTKLLCRSGECMCGTMQSQEDRREAAFFFPEWGKWLDDLELRVLGNGFKFGWGERIDDYSLQLKNGQMELFQPACVSCKFKNGLRDA